MMCSTPSIVTPFRKKSSCSCGERVGGHDGAVRCGRVLVVHGWWTNEDLEAQAVGSGGSSEPDSVRTRARVRLRPSRRPRARPRASPRALPRAYCHRSTTSSTTSSTWFRVVERERERERERESERERRGGRRRCPRRFSDYVRKPNGQDEQRNKMSSNGLGFDGRGHRRPRRRRPRFFMVQSQTPKGGFS